MDCEELIGAKQNRVLNVTVLIEAHAETVIPVSCAEKGRWSCRSREFGSGRRAMSADLKRKKSQSIWENLRAAGSVASAQGMVWQEIDVKFVRMAADPSPTMACSDLHDGHKDVTEDFLRPLYSVENQIGMIVFIGEEVAGVGFLGRFDAFKNNRSKLVRSYVMDARETALGKEISETHMKGHYGMSYNSTFHRKGAN